MSQTFELGETVRQRSSNKTMRRYIDFRPDGKPVFQKVVENRDLASVLWTGVWESIERDKALRRLLKEQPADLPDDRVSLYGCGECGDIGCGALTVKIELHETTVVWSDFGFENNYENHVNREPYANLGPFTFERREYEERLRDLLSTASLSVRSS